MPYIDQHARGQLDADLHSPFNSGELNYKITKECLRYVRIHELSYRTMNDVIGALECVKQEFYRRMVVPYEDGKIKTNGDVYP